MHYIVWALTLLLPVHVQPVIAACVESSSEPSSSPSVCNNVEGPRADDTRASLLQVTRQAGRTTHAAPKAQTTAILKLVGLDDVLLYDHLPKAGGSFVRSVLEDPKIIPPDKVRILQENQGVSDEHRQHTFTMGSVRNPCEYYVSCWAFGGMIDKASIEKAGVPFFNTSLEYYGVSDELNTIDDQQRFKKWLRYIMPQAAAPGLLTARMLWSYANQSVANAVMPEPTLQGWSEPDRLVYYQAMLAFNKSSIDCWIKTENLTADLMHCLQRFEVHTGQSLVNWSLFHEMVALRESEHASSATLSRATLNQHVWTKHTGHQSCQFYFDKGAADYVLATDSMVFSQFGYPTCCA